MLLLSEAMALGWTIQSPWKRSEPGESAVFGFCALQAAGAAIGNTGWQDWPGFNDATRLVLPCQCKDGDKVVHTGMMRIPFEYVDKNRWSNCVIHMFNHHVVDVKDWTTDQLIDWVHSNEPEIAATPEVLTLEEELASITCATVENARHPIRVTTGARLAAMTGAMQHLSRGHPLRSTSIGRCVRNVNRR